MLFTVFCLSITLVVNTAKISSFICQAKAHTMICAFLPTYIIPVNPVIVYSYFLQLSAAILSTYVISVLYALKQIIPNSLGIFLQISFIIANTKYLPSTLIETLEVWNIISRGYYDRQNIGSFDAYGTITYPKTDFGRVHVQDFSISHSFAQRKLQTRDSQ